MSCGPIPTHCITDFTKHKIATGRSLNGSGNTRPREAKEGWKSFTTLGDIDQAKLSSTLCLALVENPCMKVVYGAYKVNMINESSRHAILGIRDLSESAYVLRVERRNLEFEPGQYIHAGPLPGIDRREYSVYSSPEDDFLEILVKEIPEGVVSPGLRRLDVGDFVDVEGPFGFFRIEEGDLSMPFLFVATGTGISPFHCLTRTRPDLDYTLIHGVRKTSELYDYGSYDATRVVSCISQESGGTYRGRVTDWLRDNPPPEGCMAYLCGNCDMIYEVYDILGTQGLSSDCIHAEVYF